MAYKISLSNKTDIQIDHDELESVKNGIETGARLIKVRSGMFNPSFIISIEPDHKRLEGMKYLPKKLPDLFNRVGKMTRFEDINIQIEGPKEPVVPVEKIKEFLGEKPEFLNNNEKE